MRARIRSFGRWLVTPQEIVRSDAVFDIWPVYYPIWLLTDIVFGVPPRVYVRIAEWRKYRRERRRQENFS